MKRRPGILGPLGAPGFLAVAGVGLATFGIPEAGSPFAIPLVGGVGISLTFLAVGLHRDRETGQFLGQLILLGVAARFLLLTLIHRTIGPYPFAPDAVTYEWLGENIAHAWQGLRPMPRAIGASLQVGYPFLNAVAHQFFASPRLIPPVVNIFLSSWTAIPLYHLVMQLTRGHRGVARWAAALTVFFPSMVLWSVLNVREAPAILAIVAAVYFSARFSKRVSPTSIFGFVATLAILTTLREYLTVIVGAACAVGILMGRSRSPGRALIMGALFLMALTYVAQALGMGGSLVGDPSLDRVQYLREDMASAAGSAFGQGFDVSTPRGALTFLPIGLAYFLLGPFPWAIGSTLQATTLPESLIWYTLIPFGLLGLTLAIRINLRSFAVPLMVLFLVTFSYALIEGNVGTAYRHRAQVMPLVFIFCAIGLQDRFSVWMERRRSGQRRRREVAASMATLRGRRGAPPPAPEDAPPPSPEDA